MFCAGRLGQLRKPEVGVGKSRLPAEALQQGRKDHQGMKIAKKFLGPKNRTVHCSTWGFFSLYQPPIDQPFVSSSFSNIYDSPVSCPSNLWVKEAGKDAVFLSGE